MAGEELPPLFLFNDEPVRSFTDDNLSLKPFSSMIASAALSNRGPFNIGVFSGWGQGKTSVLRQAQSLIERENKPNVVTAWVNAWQYEHEEHPIVPLLAIIINEITKTLDSRKSADTKDDETIVKTFGHLKRALRAIAYGFSAKANAKIPGFANLEIGFVAKDMIDRDEKLSSDRDPLLDQSLYYHAYERLESFRSELEKTGAEDQPKIIVFIDDLDRCLPAKALHLLESLKLVLAQPGFIFVLGVDRHVIDSFLTKRYHEDFGIHSDMGHGRHYMDKIIQLPLDLPHHQNRFESYIDSLIGRAYMDKRLPKALYEIFASLEDAPKFRGALAAGCERNPRTLIRTLNYLLTDLFLRDNDFFNQEDDLFESSAEFLQFAAVSRITRITFGSEKERFYRKLVGSEAWMGQQLAAFLAGKENIWLSSSVGPEWGYPSGEQGYKERADDLERLEPFRTAIIASESLEELFRSTLGQTWLKEREKRLAIEGFLATREDPIQAHDESSQQIINAAIREKLGLREDQGIGDDDRRKITELDLNDTQLCDLTPIKSLTNLRSLVLNETQVSDLTVLRSLSSIERLFLNNTLVSDLTPIASLTDLSELHLSGIPVSDISALRNLTSLKRLSLSDTQVKDITALSHLSRLIVLEIDSTQVSDISSLNRLTSLQMLSINETQVSNIASIKHFSNLRWLHLENTKVINISNLKGLKQLQGIYLDGTKVRDLTPLYELKDSLQYLRIENTPAARDKATMEALHKALPDTTISI